MTKSFLHTGHSSKKVLKLVHDDYNQTDLLRNTKTQV